MNLGTATFAGGCFWCMEPPFARLAGVSGVIVGYTGGAKENPTYEEVCSGATGHCEAIQIRFDPAQIIYRELLDVFWQQIDPTDDGGQFVDRGKQYRSAIFYHDEEQRLLAEQSKDATARSGRFSRQVRTEVVPFTKFYPAEAYHQGYYLTHSPKYKSYRSNSGRDQYLQGVWGKEILSKKLTPLQYEVTQECSTEPPFQNEYWDNKREGIYVDIVSGEPLFSSRDKFDSGTGWPSFTRPMKPEHVVEREDRGLAGMRTEVRSREGNSHLGHVFPDGPSPTNVRYCINSAALRFIPKEDLEKEGYGRYKTLFE